MKANNEKIFLISIFTGTFQDPPKKSPFDRFSVNSVKKYFLFNIPSTADVFSIYYDAGNLKIISKIKKSKHLERNIYIYIYIYQFGEEWTAGMDGGIYAMNKRAAK